MEFIRARSGEQKNKRLEQIVRAALELYETVPYDKITLASIAEKLDFTRANLYKYVSSKEEIFLLVITEDFEAVVEDFLTVFAECPDGLDTEAFAKLWAATISRHERLLQLISILFTIIEKNVQVELLAVFKKRLFVDMARLQPIIRRFLPTLSDEQILHFLNMQIHYAAGLYPSTRLTEIQREAVRLSGMPYEVEDFEPVFARFLVTILHGMELTKAGN